MIDAIQEWDVTQTPWPWADNSVHCIVTSPPYYRQRDYGYSDQLGQEPTPEAYVERLVLIFREARRALHPSGTLWLNLDDSYAGPSTAGPQRSRSSESPGACKPKDLIGIPWLVAIALRNDGWYLRSEIVWAKGRCMPESVKDRPTATHEKIFLLTKSPRYYYDWFAARERSTYGHESRYARKGTGLHSAESHAGSTRKFGDEPAYRNGRNLWRINPEQFQGAHFAVMPTDLARRAIIAGSSARGVCPECGEPWQRIISTFEPLHYQRLQSGANADGTYDGKAAKDYAGAGAQDAAALKKRILENMREQRTTGWEPGCQCGAAESVPAVVGDPFSGAGTTALVARLHGRRYAGLEANSEFIELSKRRLARPASHYRTSAARKDEPDLFASVADPGAA